MSANASVLLARLHAQHAKMGVIPVSLKLQTGDELMGVLSDEHQRILPGSHQKLMYGGEIRPLAIEQVCFCGPARTTRLSPIDAVDQFDEGPRITRFGYSNIKGEHALARHDRHVNTRLAAMLDKGVLLGCHFRRLQWGPSELDSSELDSFVELGPRGGVHIRLASVSLRQLL
jgi:hypothetical protein